MRSLEVDTMYSAWLGFGFHWTSATSHVPPCGRKRGTSNGASRSIMNKPFLLRGKSECSINLDYIECKHTQRGLYLDWWGLCSSIVVMDSKFACMSQNYMYAHALTFPTESPTMDFISICKPCSRFPSSSGESISCNVLFRRPENG